MRFILPVIGAAFICFLGGCVLPQQEGAARYLPESNVFYTCTAYTDFARRLSDTLDATHQDFQQSDLPDEAKQEWSVILASIRLAALHCGLNENLSSGTSCRRLAGEKTQFHTIRVLATRPPAQGVLWQFSGNRTVNLKQSLAQLPAETLAAIVLAVDTDAIRQPLLKTLETLYGKAARLNEQHLFSGIWQWVCLPGEDGIYAELSLPDPDGTGYELLTQFLPQTPDGISYLPGNGRIPELKVIFSAGRTRITSGKKQETAPRQLLTKPEIQAGLQHLPADGIGVFYLSAEAGKYMQPDRPAPLRPIPEVLGMLSRMPDALILQTISDWDPVSESHLIPAVMTPIPGFMKLFLYLDWMKKTSASLQTNRECTGQMQSIRTALNSYAANHQGKFPAADGIEGFRELLKTQHLSPKALLCPSATGDTPAENAEKFTADNCSYVYIGGSTVKTPADFPLVIDWPLNHKDEFHMLTISGKILSFQFKNLDSCRKAVSFLQSRFLYPEPDFLRLLKVADTLDTTFLKGQSK